MVISLVAKKAKHNVSKISISLISLQADYDPNASPYINGCYYVYLDYKLINNTGAEIDYITVDTYFKDKSGRLLGTVKAEFGGYYSSSMQLQVGESQTHQIYISESQPARNEFFTTMYNSKLSDFTVTFKIKSVSFSDGEHYFSE